MKFKVTVECEEGLKATSNVNMTSEGVMISMAKYEFEKMLEVEITAAALRAMRKISNFIEDNKSMIVQYNDEATQTRKVHIVKDVDEIRDFKLLPPWK